MESTPHNKKNNKSWHKKISWFHACTSHFYYFFFSKGYQSKIYNIITCLYECILMKHSFHSIIYYNLVDCRASKYISLTSNSYSPFIINFFFLSVYIYCLSFNFYIIHEEITNPIISIVIIFNKIYDLHVSLHRFIITCVPVKQYEKCFCEYYLWMKGSPTQ